MIQQQQAMHLYTFITEYKGGTYIIQVKAQHIEEAAPKWADEMLSEHIPGLDRQSFQSAFQERMDEFKLAKIDDTKNVWHLHFSLGATGWRFMLSTRCRWRRKRTA